MKYYSTIKTHLWYTKCHVCISKPLCCTEEGKRKRNNVLPHFYEVNKSNHGDRNKEKDSFGVLGVVRQSMDWLEKVTKGTFWDERNVLCFEWWDGNVGIVIYQTHQSVHLKWV